MKKRIISLGLLLSIMIGNIPITSFASTNKTPTLNAYQLGNNAKLEWAIEMDDNDVLYKTGFEIGEETPSGMGAGGQSIATEDKYSGQRSVKIIDTYTNGNWYQFPDTSGTRSIMTFTRKYFENGTNLSVSFKAKSDLGGTIMPNGDGGWANEIIYLKPKYVKNAIAGSTVLHLDSMDDIYLGRHILFDTDKDVIGGYYQVRDIDMDKKTITLNSGIPRAVSVGENVVTRTWRGAWSFSSRQVPANNQWTSFSINTQVANHADYNVAIRGGTFYIGSSTKGKIYIDDIKFGYATKAELYRDNTKIYEGFLSDYDDKAATDKVKPNKVESVTLSLKDGNASFNIVRPNDNGTKYSYQVMSVNHQGQKTPSIKKDVTITSGVKGYSYVLDKNPNTVPGTTINETTDTIKVPINTNEKYYLHVRAIDGAGNASDVSHYEVQDNTAPELTLVSTNTNPTNKDVVINANATDSGLGVKEIILPDSSVVAGNKASFTVSQNGNYSFTAKDYAGNVTTKSITISNIDKVLPVITIEDYIKTPTNKDITVTAKVDKGTLNKNSHTFTQNGSFEFTATDEAGNISAPVNITITNIDKTAPTMPSVELNKSSHKLVLKEGTDNESGVDKSLYSINNGEWINFTNEVDVSNFSDGDYTINLKTIDKAGNESMASLGFKIDYQEAKDNISSDIDGVVVDKDTDLNDILDIIDQIQEEIDKLPNGPERDELQGKLDNLKDLVEAENQNRLDDANDLIDNDLIIDEDTDLADLEDIIGDLQEKIDKLPDGPEKDNLQDKLDDLQNKLDEESNKRNEDINNAIDEIPAINEDTDLRDLEDIISNLQEEIDKLPNGPAKDELQDKLNDLKDKLDEEVANKGQEIEDLINNVVIDGDSNLQDIVDIIDNIKDMIDKLPDGEIKNNLQNMLDELQDKLDEENNKRIEDTNNAIDDNIKVDDSTDLDDLGDIIGDLQEKIDKLPSGDEKDKLQDMLDDLQNKLNEENDKRLEEATKAVELAEATKREPYIQNAKDKVSLLKESPEKTALEDRIKAINYVDVNAANLKNADIAVALAEATKRDPYITRAKDKVSSLVDSIEKDDLKLRLFNLEELLSRNTELTLKNAERLVSTAESTKRASNLLQAKEGISKLKPSNEKTEFLIRLESLALEIVGLELTEEAIEVIKATHYVEMAELYDYSFVLRKAYEVVEKLEDSEGKTSLVDRLNNLHR